MGSWISAPGSGFFYGEFDGRRKMRLQEGTISGPQRYLAADPDQNTLLRDAKYCVESIY